MRLREDLSLGIIRPRAHIVESLAHLVEVLANCTKDICIYMGLSARYSTSIPTLTTQAMEPILFQATLVSNLGVDCVTRDVQWDGSVK